MRYLEDKLKKDIRLIPIEYIWENNLWEPYPSNIIGYPGENRRGIIISQPIGSATVNYRVKKKVTIIGILRILGFINVCFYISFKLTGLFL